MKKLWIALGISLVVGVGLALWRNTGPGEPVYEGKPLSRWLQATDPPYDDPAAGQKADLALRHIGTNAIPTLLKLIQAKDPPGIVLKLLQWAQTRRLLFTNHRYAVTHAMRKPVTHSKYWDLAPRRLCQP